MAEVFLLVAIVPLPLLLGVAAALLKKPWWWAAALGVVIAMVVMIAPQPEAGESRVATGDIPFLLIVDVWVVGVVWLTNYLARRLREAAQSQESRSPLIARTAGQHISKPDQSQPRRRNSHTRRTPTTSISTITAG